VGADAQAASLREVRPFVIAERGVARGPYREYSEQREDPMKIKGCVITASRSEYGLLRWIMTAIRDDPEFELLTSSLEPTSPLSTA